MSFAERTAKRFVAIKAARQLKEEIDKAGLDNLKALAAAGKSILGIYLKGCSPEEKKRLRRDGKALGLLGVTPEMVLTQLAGQKDELSSIMKKNKDYWKNELQNFERFLREES